MSDFVPQSIELVGWAGDSGQLALRLGVSETRLLAALRRVGRKGDGWSWTPRPRTSRRSCPLCGDGWPRARTYISVCLLC